MPKRATKDMVQLGTEIPEELYARLVERCDRLGVRKSDEVRLAIRRHLDYPPADVSPPLPDAAERVDVRTERVGELRPSYTSISSAPPKPAKGKPAAGGAKGKRKK